MRKIPKDFDYIKIKLASPFKLLQWASRQLPNGQFVGEVKTSETINYRTFKPEMDGLFCERIFGPNKSLECACGKYKRIRYEGLICQKCGVEVTESRVRRHRMGYINLIYPVTHVWYMNSRPNFMSLLLEVEQFEKKLDTTNPNDYPADFPYSQDHANDGKDLCKRCNRLKFPPARKVALWDDRIKRIKLASLAYFIADDDISFYGLHWDLQQYRKSVRAGQTRYPLKPILEVPMNHISIPKYLVKATPHFLIGAPLIKKELENLDLNSEICKMRRLMIEWNEVYRLRQRMAQKKDVKNYSFRKWEQQRLSKILSNAIKRIRILENFVGTGSNPSWMILTILPVIPPALRPMIQLEGGRFATSDLNELYRRIIARNNRLFRLLKIDAPQVVIRNEKRLLQEAVDSLIDNGKRGKISLSSNNRPLKSLSDIIKGKHGRFRQNLLGKRVDYSGRSVIVVGPSLKLNQCGLPYEMALELFQPFIIRELINQGLANNIKIAKNFISKNELILDPLLQKVLKNHPIFLNRAPTLHRLGIQAFEVLLIRGRAIKLHPLVCSAFNADFDGDQMAVHIPLSPEAQSECYMLMLAPYNFLSAANGEPIIMPSQDMVLGCYYLTVNNMLGSIGSNHYFSDLEDVILAYSQNLIEIHTDIWIRLFSNDLIQDDSQPIQMKKLEDNSFIEFYKNHQIRKANDGSIISYYIRTTTGRALFNYVIKKSLNFLETETYEILQLSK
jgi:DNA-directed RNA polymerase subunit beta'